jgi:iron complex outermembrane receptor protein
MRVELRRIFSSLVALTAFGAAPLAAQEGTVAGRVVDEETGQPLGAAQVQVLGAEGEQASGVLSENDGRFRIRLAPGSYSVVSTLVGYRQARVDGITVTAGQTTQVEIRMTSTAFELNPVVVTASRRQEKILDSPSNIQIVPQEQIEERTVLQPTEHVRNLPGVDMAQNGLTSSAVVTRGFNNVFSGGLLVLVDNRIASVPSLRVNQFNMIPTSQPDIERMEVLLGPAAALYGPNSANGVLHIITSSPIDDAGTTASIAGGERSVFQTQFSTSHRLSDNVGLRVAGNYMQGDDWEYTDPVEVREADANPGNPLIGNRDFNTERYGGEVRLDIRPWDDGEVIFNAGYNNLASSIELTGLGAGQGQDWIYSYVQGRLRKGGLFMQAFLNQSDAGDTYLLRTGQPIVDKSRMFVSQIQYAFGLGESQEFISGIDVQRTEPRTEGTITGRNEDDDIINEVGGYLHSETALSESLSLVAALRVDYHNRIDDLIYSPRAALVFKPSGEHTFRATFNRAFSTPTTNNLFLDLRAGSIPIPGTPGYDVRTLGVPESGFTFQDECQGGFQNFCMYSPFNPQGPGSALPANAALFWNSLIVEQFLRPQLGAAADLLLNPQPGTIGTLLRRFNQEAENPADAFPVDGAGPEAIDQIVPTITNTFEVGWKGLLGSKLLISADLYSSQITDFVGPLRVETPSVFLDPQSVGAYLGQQLAPLVQAGQITPAQIGAITEELAGIPLGTISPDQVGNTDLILTYRNFGDVDLWGADLGFQFLATNRLSFSGSTSFVSEECFDFNDDGNCTSASDISLNAPTFKGNLGVRFSDKLSGFSAEARMRYSDGFTMNSGVFIGEVPEYTVFDANVAYQLPWATGATVSVTGTNIFDNMRREFVGAPEIGRLVMVRLQYAF